MQRTALMIALGLNAMMFVIGIVAGWLAHSSGLQADALDMLADATGYAVGLLAIGRGARFKFFGDYILEKPIKRVYAWCAHQSG